MEDDQCQQGAASHFANVHHSSPHALSPVTPNVSETLRRMSRPNRAAIFRSIVAQLDSSDAHYLLELVKRKLSFDPFRELPSELHLPILTHLLSPVDLLRLVGVCRAWRHRIMRDDRIWKERMRRVQLSRPAKSFLGPRVADCITALRWEINLSRNWTNGVYTCRVSMAAHGSGVVTCMHLDERKSMLITGADNGTIGLWNTINGECKRLLSGHQGGVWTLKVSPDGRRMVTGSTDRTLILWDIETGERLFDLVGHSSTVRCVEIVRDRIISGSRDGTLRIWDLNTGQCLHILTGHTASVRCIIAWHDRYIVSGSYDHTLRVWDVLGGNGECISVCTGHDGKIYCLAATEEYVFSGGIDARVKAWCPLTGQCIATFTEHAALVGLLELHGNNLVAGSTDGSLSVWNVQTLQRVRHVEMAHRSSITALSLNRYALFTGAERSLRLWNLAELCCSNTLALAEEPVESLIVSEKPEVVWRVVLGEAIAIIAYQQAGSTRIDILNFSPS